MRRGDQTHTHPVRPSIRTCVAFDDEIKMSPYYLHTLSRHACAGSLSAELEFSVRLQNAGRTDAAADATSQPTIGAPPR
jgi:hypothetical protein